MVQAEVQQRPPADSSTAKASETSSSPAKQEKVAANQEKISAKQEMAIAEPAHVNGHLDTAATTSGRSGPGSADTPDDMAAQSKEQKADSSAAVMVQRMYRGHRERRRLADLALLEQEKGWSSILDAVSLQKQNTGFVESDEDGSAAKKWLRLKSKASKVGKGLGADEKARLLSIGHWLEAVDARHRYGHNLQLYYQVWQQSDTQQPFFYWLDVGEGQSVDLEECPRKKLQGQLIKYLTPVERMAYEVEVVDGKLLNRLSQKPIHTESKQKWIFVMDAHGRLYISTKDKGRFQHSSFLSGAATKAAGRLRCENGTLKLMEAHSGHYHPTKENFDELLRILTEKGVDLREAKVQYVSDDLLGAEVGNASRKDDSSITYVLEPDSKDGNLEASAREDPSMTADIATKASVSMEGNNGLQPVEEPIGSKKDSLRRATPTVNKLSNLHEQLSDGDNGTLK